MKTINRLHSLRALATLVLGVLALAPALALPPEGGGPDPDGPKPPAPSGPADLIVTSATRPNYYTMVVTVKNIGYRATPPTTLWMATYTVRPYIVLGAGEHYLPGMNPGQSRTLTIYTNYSLYTYGARIDFDPNPNFQVTESDYLNNWHVIFNPGYTF
jgi:hypothetical protein